MIQARKLGHVVLKVRDAGKSRDFYVKTLGLKVAHEDLTRGAVFLSFGTEHHDLAVFQMASGETPAEVASPRRAFATSLAATASNPLTIASWGAVFAAASTAGIAESTDSAVAFVGGVGLGSMAWVTILAVGVSAARARVGSRLLKTLDAAAGSAIVAFGGLLAWRTLRESS